MSTKEINDEIKGYLKILGFSERDLDVMKDFDFKLHEETVNAARRLSNIKEAIARYDGVICQGDSEERLILCRNRL